MKTVIASLAALAASAGLAFAAPSQAADQPKIAFTFDDLPAHASLPQGESRTEIAKRIIDALKAAGAPEVYGFVNGFQIQNEPASEAVLAQWRAAGFPLGNHTWSHMNLNTNPAAAWEAEAEKTETLLKTYMGDGDWKWMRYPFLAEGDTPDKKGEARKWLAQHGYKIAAVTMGFGDYAFNDPYTRCVAKGDQAGIKALETAYLDYAAQSIDYYRALSKAAYGREIPYVILMHLGALDSRVMPQLLEIFKAKGFKFVTLKEAESDPFYKDAVDPSLPVGPETLEGAMYAKGQAPPPKSWDLGKIGTICQ
jgi:peptidoglycan/xylan/chitin deacetylase (PgdA/CDA1 family)